MADTTHSISDIAPKPILVKGWPLLRPSFLDLFFIAIITWLFALGSAGWNSLLADGDTGWHIRAGDYIRQNRQFIHQDFFSFSKQGQLWFAWEWLSEVLFSYLNAFGGLKAIVLFRAVVITLSFTIVFRHMIWRGATPLVAMAISLVATGAASNHYLARPHVITFLFLSISLFLIDVDRKKNTKWLWILAPLTIVWTNLHGGFFSLIACLGLVVIGSAIDRNWKAVVRYGSLGALCLSLSIVNPYGIALHKHMVEYLRSDWIKSVVEEFQSPSFRNENVLQFEMLMFVGIGFAGYLAAHKKYVEALLILFWAHNALQSVRHISVFVLVASPIIAAEISKALATLCAGKSKILESMSQDLMPACQGGGLWITATILGFAMWNDPSKWPQDFPKEKFPVALVTKHKQLLEKSRVLSTDEWGDYMIYRLYPDIRVFFDGRSDFYGPALGKEFVDMLQASFDWEQLVEKHQFTVALIPPSCPLASLLKRDGRWSIVEDNGNEILLVKRSLNEGSVKANVSTDREKKVPVDLMKNTDNAEVSRGDHKS